MNIILSSTYQCMSVCPSFPSKYSSIHSSITELYNHSSDDFRAVIFKSMIEYWWRNIMLYLIWLNSHQYSILLAMILSITRVESSHASCLTIIDVYQKIYHIDLKLQHEIRWLNQSIYVSMNDDQMVVDTIVTHMHMHLLFFHRRLFLLFLPMIMMYECCKGCAMQWTKNVLSQDKNHGLHEAWKS